MARLNPKLAIRGMALLKRQKVMRASELVKYFGNTAQLSRKAESGAIIPLGTGIYASTNVDPFKASLLAAARYYPSVLSGLTALVLHGLSDERIDRIDIDINRGKSLKNKLLNVHRVAKSRLIGAYSMKILGETVRVYDLERTLAEAYRLDKEGPIFYKALKRYIKKGRINSANIHKYDKVLKTNVLMHLQQELANG